MCYMIQQISRIQSDRRKHVHPCFFYLNYEFIQIPMSVIEILKYIDSILKGHNIFYIFIFCTT